MTGTALVTEIVQILVSGITGIAQGVGAVLSELARAIFFTTTGDTETLSVMGILIISFAGISLTSMMSTRITSTINGLSGWLSNSTRTKRILTENKRLKPL